MADTTVTEDPRRESPVLPLPEDRAVELVAELEHSWRTACGDEPRRSSTIGIAGNDVAVETADDALGDRLWSALAHLEIPASAASRPDLTIRVWSLDDPSRYRPRLPEPLGSHGDVVAHRPGPAGTTTIRARFDHPARAVMAWHEQRRVAWWCIDRADGLPWWEEAAPFRPLWSWYLPARGAHLAHGAAVGTEAGAVLLVGPGGSGKSTTALAVHLDGIGYVGDDYCAVTLSPVPTVHSLFGTAKLRVDAGVEHGPLAGHLLRPTPPPGGKAVALVSARPGAPLVRSAPIVAVAAIRVGDGPDTEVIDATRPEVLAALAPSSLTQLPGVGASSLRAFTRLVGSVPVCRIQLGHDRSGVVAAIRSLLDDPTRRTGHRSSGAPT